MSEGLNGIEDADAVACPRKSLSGRPVVLAFHWSADEAGSSPTAPRAHLAKRVCGSRCIFLIAVRRFGQSAPSFCVRPWPSTAILRITLFILHTTAGFASRPHQTAVGRAVLLGSTCPQLQAHCPPAADVSRSLDHRPPAARGRIRQAANLIFRYALRTHTASPTTACRRTPPPRAS